MWECRTCRERQEGSFEVCWNCGTSKDGTEDPSFRRAEDCEPRSLEPAAAAVRVGKAAPARPARRGTCPKCGSGDVIPNVRVVDRGDNNSKRDLQVEVYESPEAWLFKGTHAGTITATVCGRCGYAEMYVSNPQELLAAYRKSTGELRDEEP
jgi:hypothetical protein